MLRQVEAAHRIREAFFPAGSNAPDVRFTAMLENLDRSARRFVLQVDGQNADDRQGPQRRWPFKWPASDPGTAAATFEDRSGAWPTQSFGGPWAFFRLLDLGQMQRETPLRAALNFQQGNYRTRVLIEASSIRNPFTDREWQRFSCGASRATT
jgi:type VI secretion system protein ImpL